MNHSVTSGTALIFHNRQKNEYNNSAVKEQYEYCKSREARSFSPRPLRLERPTERSKVPGSGGVLLVLGRSWHLAKQALQDETLLRS